MHVQDLLAATDVGQRDVHLTVEAAGAQQRRIQNVRAVGGRDHDHAQVGLEAVHLDQHLVQRLLALVVAAAEARATLAAHGVDFVDEDDARRILLGVLEHVAHARRAHADEHFDKVGARDAEERHLGFARDGFRQQRFTRAGRADQQQAARNAAAKLLEFLRVFQEVDDFLHLFLGLVATGDIGKGDGVVVLVQHARLGFAEAERAALAAALHLAHEVHPYADQQQHGTPADEQRHQQRAFFARLDVEFHAMVDEVADQATIKVRGLRAHTAVVVHLGDDVGAALAFLDGGFLHSVVAHLFEEVGVRHVTGAGHAAAVQLLEHSEQHHGDHHPHGDLRKPLIFQGLTLQSKKPGNAGYMQAILGISTAAACGKNTEPLLVKVVLVPKSAPNRQHGGYRRLQP